MDFLFHKVSEKEKEEIQNQAKLILDDFSKQLSEVKENVGEALIERENCERQEGKDNCLRINREIFFENAPNKTDDHIVAEVKKW